MQTVTIKEKEYHIGKVNAFRQLHLVKRMAPITAKIISFASAYGKEDTAVLVDALGAALASLPDADVDFIVQTCMEAVTVKQTGGNFAPLCTKGNMMFEVDLMTLLALTAHVMQENLSTFFSEVHSLLSAAEEAPQQPQT